MPSCEHTIVDEKEVSYCWRYSFGDKSGTIIGHGMLTEESVRRELVLRWGKEAAEANVWKYGETQENPGA